MALNYQSVDFVKVLAKDVLADSMILTDQLMKKFKLLPNC